jgi:hypothetical protein
MVTTGTTITRSAAIMEAAITAVVMTSAGTGLADTAATSADTAAATTDP